MFASDYRREAREALRGNWIRTTLILLLATLLGASAGVTSVDLGSGGVEYDMSLMEYGVSLEQFRDIVRIMLVVLIVLNLISIFIGSLVRVGMFSLGESMFNGEQPRVAMLFPRGIYGKAVGLKLLTMLFVSLWSLLFVIPGIIASYRYAMAEYLLCKYPQLTAMQAIAMSKQRMAGHKMRLFSLELSFIGWSLLCTAPAVILSYVAVGTAASLPMLLTLLAVSLLLSIAGSALLNAYMHLAVCSFFRHLDHPWHGHQAEQQFGWKPAAGESGAPETREQEDPQREEARPAVDTESVAREIFHRHGCSRQRIIEAGEMEIYAACRVDSSVEHRWLREYGQTLMLRFGNDPAALDDLLPLISEYGMDDLLDRAIERVERHSRQSSLPDGEIMNMAGRCLAVVTSGAFADRESYAQRKQAQLADMARRLAAQLEETDPEGGWRSAYAMICQMAEMQ